MIKLRNLRLETFLVIQSPKYPQVPTKEGMGIRERDVTTEAEIISQKKS